jgi:hypothetical protein
MEQLIGLFREQMHDLKLTQDSQMNGFAQPLRQTHQRGARQVNQATPSVIGIAQLNTAYTQAVSLTLGTLLDVSTLLQCGQQPKDIVLV